MTTNPFLSIIIPAYNEESRLPSTLLQVANFLRAQDYTCEVLVVENGSRDATFQIAEQFAHQHPNFRVLQETLRGKGRAVQRGMLEARGDYRFMCDADLSMPIDQLNRFIQPLLADFDVAIASREARGSIRYNEPAYRHIGGRLINLMIRLLALPHLEDTQCGFKCFRGDVAQALFRQQTLPGWSFDVEILFIARRSGYRVIELPIPWYFNPESKLNVIKDAFQIGLDLLTIRRNAWRGVYKSL